MSAMEGQLLAKARPYLVLFALLTLLPPPSCYEGGFGRCRKRALLCAFGCYTCCVFVLGIYVTYVNIITLNLEISILEVEDFTSALGMVQKTYYSVLLAIMHGNMMIYFRRLGRIFKEIATLELDIDAASQCYGGLRRRNSLRQRLAILIGLWIAVLFVAFPRITIPVLTEYMSWRNKMLTEFIMLVLQIKSVEFVLFVVLVQELQLRLRRSLIDLQQELTACEDRVLMQALCTAIQRNKQLMSRIWNLVSELEVYFMLPMLGLFLYNGLAMLHIVNWAYIQSVNPNDCINCRFWRIGNLVFLLINLLIPCWVCQNFIGTYNSFKRIIHNIRSGHENVSTPMLSNGLREYALQLEHLKLRFTCGGFFDINLNNFGGMLVTIVSYTIILIQFKLQGLLETKRKLMQQANGKSS